jgi:hypothetical protein
LYIGGGKPTATPPSDWDGKKSLGIFQNCAVLSTKTNSLDPTPGYAGPAIVLGDAEAQLTACITRAKQEKARRHHFEAFLRDGQRELQDRRAEISLNVYFEKLIDPQETICHAINLAETMLANAWIERAATEVDRQKIVKQHFADVLVALDDARCAPHNELSGGCCSNIEDAIKSCKAALDIEEASLMHCDSTISLPPEDATVAAGMDATDVLHAGLLGECNALKHILHSCEHWHDGDNQMAMWDGKSALVSYNSAEVSAGLAVAEPKTNGYCGTKIQFNSRIISALQAAAANARELNTTVHFSLHRPDL